MSAQALGESGALPRSGAAPFLAWPGRSHLLYATALAGANGLWFMAVFAGSDFIASQHGWRVPVHFAAELAIPFVAPMTAIYMSMYLLFIAAPFILRGRAEFRAAVATLAALIGVAGLFFLLMPATLAHASPREDELGAWAGLFHLADDLNLTYNLLPSLHVGLTVACVAAFATRATRAGAALLWAWAAAIGISTLLTHQHHVLDVIVGWLLALAAFRRIYPRMTLTP